MSIIQQDRGRAITAVGLIGLGILFLLGQVFGFSLFSVLWPFFVILPGAAFLYAALRGGKQAAGLAVPGSVITGTGLILLYQSITNHWASWAYAWTLYPVFVGLALSFMSERTGDENLGKVGRGLVRWGGIAFLGAAAFFELVLFGGGGVFGGLAAPLLLIGIGALMLLGKGLGGGRKSKNDTISYSRSKAKYTFSAAVNDDLQRKIDAALAEADEPESQSNHTTMV